MSSKIIDELKQIKISNYIYGIFILVSFIGFYSNKKEKDYLFTGNIKEEKHAHNARLIILIIALIIYIYYLEVTVKSNKNSTEKFLSNLNVLAAILFLIGGLITLYVEIKGDEQVIIAE